MKRPEKSLDVIDTYQIDSRPSLTLKFELSEGEIFDRSNQKEN